MLFSTHLTTDLERVADRVAVLRNGRVAFDGELADLKDNVKWLRIIGSLPTGFVVPNQLMLERGADGAVATVSSGAGATAQMIARGLNAEVTIEDLNLEEIFVEMHR